MPSCHSYQIQRNSHSAQYFLATLKATYEKSLMFYTCLKNKQTKNGKRYLGFHMSLFFEFPYKARSLYHIKKLPS